ncbi:MAG: DNA replication/repair protein RecF [Deltaproteobacteria bacterium]|nr:MAG: DNA replication/repair protein RecF [Deltaproteobacteria bacterium]
MRIEHLVFRGFRNFEDLDLSPAPGINLVWGDNGQGKTNLLEGIYLLAQLKSFRPARQEHLIARGAGAASLAVRIRVSDVQHRLEMNLTPGERRLRADGQQLTATAEFLGRLRVILFAPEETTVVRGAPSGRRAMLDRGIFLADSGYLRRAREYRRCLLQRNSLLRSGQVSAKVLEPWTVRLAESGAELRRRRNHYLERLRPLLQQCYLEISGGRERVDIRLPTRGGDDVEALLNELHRQRDREFSLGQTLAGPHRDDVAFQLDGRPLRQYGSQGQQRSFVLAFKCAQLLDFQQTKGFLPVLLLDDINSELDGHRREAFFAFLLANSGQVFLTSTDADTCRIEDRQLTRYYMHAGSLAADHDRGKNS